MADPSDRNVPPPLDLVSPQLTARALLTGMLLGGLLSVCNVYLGLKIGWGTGMSITGVLLGFALWKGIEAVGGSRVRPFNVLENNINQAAVSAAAAVSSAGLVAPIPALAMMTGETLPWILLAAWVFVVCLVGITAATGLRKQMILVDKLPFPSGLACAETLREIYGHGREALQRVGMLGLAALIAGAVKLLEILKLSAALKFPGTLAGAPASSLGWRIDPSLLMFGVGGLIGTRAGVSILLGSILAWAVIGPAMVNRGNAELMAFQPAASIPTTVNIAPSDDLQFRPARGRLEQRGPMALADRDRWLAANDSPEWREAIERLYVASNLATPAARAEFLGPGRPTSFEWTTTRPLQRSTTMPVELAKGWGDPKPVLPLPPPRWSGMLRVTLLTLEGPSNNPSPRSAEVRLDGPPPAALLDDLRERVESETDPARKRADAALLAAVESLATVEPAAVVVPESLRMTTPPTLRFDEATQSFVASGAASLDAAGEALKGNGALTQAAVDEVLVANAGARNADIKATLTQLVAASAMTVPKANFADLLGWLLWPGVTLMVVSSLMSLAFSWRSMLRTITGSRSATEGDAALESAAAKGDLPKSWFIAGCLIALVLATVMQMSLFGILWWAAILGVLLSFVLAVVATRVAGETNITPIGAMGKVTQLVFGVVVPNSAAANLMSANVTGGAASQCADLMHDFKCGYLLGASPRKQFIGQIAGAFSGALVASWFYLILIPNPAEQLMTAEWPAPAVAAWKAVAELFLVGLDALPRGTPMAMLIAGIFGILLPVLEKVVPKGAKLWVPSAASVGLAFVVGAEYAVLMFIGAMVALVLGKIFPNWTARFFVTICAGLVVGDSLVGAGDAIAKVLGGV